MRIQRRTLLAAGLMGMARTATQGLAAASNTRTRFIFHVSSTWGDLFDWLVDRAYAPITAELEKRGFPSMLSHSSVRGSDTPNEDRASAVVKALQNVTDDVVIVGISNQGNFLPLVAAARPIRRVVYVNALIPRPGKAFIEVCQTEQVAVPGSYLDKLLKASQSITDDFVKLIHNPNTTKAQLKAMQERIDASSSAHTLVGFYEVCPLKALPNVDNVYVSGSADEQIRPEWEQSAAVGSWASSRSSFLVLAMRTSSQRQSMQLSLRTFVSRAFDAAARQRHVVQGRVRPNISWPRKRTARGHVLDDEQRWRRPRTQRPARLHDAFPAGLSITQRASW